MAAPVLAPASEVHRSVRKDPSGSSPIWELADFAAMRAGAKVGDQVFGPKFSVGDRRFLLIVHPVGLDDGTKDFVSLGLGLLDAPAEDHAITVSFTFYVVDPSGIPLTGFPAETFKRQYHTNGSAWSDHLSQDLILDSLHDGALFLRAHVVVHTAEVTTTVALKAPAIDVPAPNVTADLGRMLSGGEGADVEFAVAAEWRAPAAILRAHSLILSHRSEVFAAMLSGPLAVVTTSRRGGGATVALEGVRSDVFRSVLRFAYTDEVAADGEGVVGLGTVEGAQHLLAAADRFGLPRLRALCERRLAESLEPRTAAYTLTLAEQHSAGALREAALRFVGEHLKEVMATEGYSHMLKSAPHLASELLARSAGLASPPAVVPDGEVGSGEGGAGGAGEDGAVGGRRVRRRQVPVRF